MNITLISLQVLGMPFFLRKNSVVITEGLRYKSEAFISRGRSLERLVRSIAETIINSFESEAFFLRKNSSSMKRTFHALPKGTNIKSEAFDMA